MSKLRVICISVGIIFNVAEFCLRMFFFGLGFVLMHTLHLAIHSCLLKIFFMQASFKETLFSETQFSEI